MYLGVAYCNLNLQKMRLKRRLKLLKYDYMNFRSGLLPSIQSFNCLNGQIKKEEKRCMNVRKNDSINYVQSSLKSHFIWVTLQKTFSNCICRLGGDMVHRIYIIDERISCVKRLALQSQRGNSSQSYGYNRQILKLYWGIQ